MVCVLAVRVSLEDFLTESSLCLATNVIPSWSNSGGVTSSDNTAAVWYDDGATDRAVEIGTFPSVSIALQFAIDYILRNRPLSTLKHDRYILAARQSQH